MARQDRDGGIPLPDGGEMLPLKYGSLDYNTHPIDTYRESHGFGPFETAWSPWEFQDPASSVDVGYTGSNTVHIAPVATTYQQLFTDRTTDTINQMLAAQAADVHQKATGGWLHDLLGGLGEGVIGGGAS